MIGQWVWVGGGYAVPLERVALHGMDGSLPIGDNSHHANNLRSSHLISSHLIHFHRVTFTTRLTTTT